MNIGGFPEPTPLLAPNHREEPELWTEATALLLTGIMALNKPLHVLSPSKIMVMVTALKVVMKFKICIYIYMASNWYMIGFHQMVAIIIDNLSVNMSLPPWVGFLISE